MATILPPPSKKQKTADAKRAQEQQEIDSIPDNLGSIRIQFHDATTGAVQGPPVSVPVSDATTKNIELILNTLLGNVGLPYVQSMHRNAR
jgi:ribosome assembly protein 4